MYPYWHSGFLLVILADLKYDDETPGIAVIEILASRKPNDICSHTHFKIFQEVYVNTFEILIHTIELFTQAFSISMKEMGFCKCMRYN